MLFRAKPEAAIRPRTVVESCRPRYQGFFKVALTAALRDTTSAEAGWPYIALPNSRNGRSSVTTLTSSRLRTGSPFILVLGDSAPCGVHIPTDKLIAQIALDAGFKQSRIEVLRTRGDKWAKNPQRHKVPLRESNVTLIKQEFRMDVSSPAAALDQQVGQLLEDKLVGSLQQLIQSFGRTIGPEKLKNGTDNILD